MRVPRHVPFAMHTCAHRTLDALRRLISPDGRRLALQPAYAYVRRNDQ